MDIIRIIYNQAVKYGIGFRDLLIRRSLSHIQEIGVAAEVQLGVFQFNASVGK